MVRFKGISKSFLFFITVIAVLAVAAFVQTTVQFFVPISVSFTVFTLGGGGNFTTSKAALGGNYTEVYYFNTTSIYAEMVVPCADADGATNCQSGPNTPAYRIRNTGNVNLTFTMNLSSALTGSGVNLCANSTKPTGCPQNVIGPCVLSGQGNLNASSWLDISANVGLNTPCFETNVTLYANFSAATPGTITTRVITVNSTSS